MSMDFVLWHMDNGVIHKYYYYDIIKNNFDWESKLNIVIIIWGFKDFNCLIFEYLIKI